MTTNITNSGVTVKRSEVGECLEAAKQHITFSLGLNFPIRKPTWHINYMKKDYKLHIHQNTKSHLKTKQQNKTSFKPLSIKKYEDIFLSNW